MPKRKHQRGSYLTASSKLAHAENRLYERYGNIDFKKLSNLILKSREFIVLEEDDKGAVCLIYYNNKEIYFILHNRYRGDEIATFLTKEMAEKTIKEKEGKNEGI